MLAVDDLHSSSVENSWLNSRQQHFNRWAVYATMARIYHWKGNIENALLYANKVIESKQLTFFDPSKENKGNNSWDVAFYSESIFSLNKEEIQDVYSKRFDKLENTVLYNQKTDIESLYEITAGKSTDYRFEWAWYLYNDPNSNYERYKYYRYNPSVAKYPKLVTLIRLSEMYYIAAECKGNTKEGLDLLNEVLVNRGLSTLGEMSDEDYQDAILKEYRKEFFCEGQLFFYYKRLNEKSIYHRTGSLVEMRAGYVFPIPEDELELRNGVSEE